MKISARSANVRWNHSSCALRARRTASATSSGVVRGTSPTRRPSSGEWISVLSRGATVVTIAARRARCASPTRGLTGSKIAVAAGVSRERSAIGEFASSGPGCGPPRVGCHRPERYVKLRHEFLTRHGNTIPHASCTFCFRAAPAARREVFLLVLRVAVFGLVVTLFPLLIWAQAPQAGSAESEYTAPLGIALEAWPYPWPVRFLELDIEGRRERMAFMDVPPTGKANGRSVMLFHGKNFFGAYWEGTARALSAAGYRVVIPDQIGFGKSSKPDVHYSFDLLAANSARLLDELGVRQTAVVGHSMGGMLAVRFTRTYPERVTHLVLENPIGLEDYRLKVPPRPTDALVANEMNQTEAQIRAFLKMYPAHWVPEVFERYVEVRSRIRLSGEFPLIRRPTLLVIGQADRTVLGRDAVSEEVKATLGLYPELGRAAARDIPGAQLVELAWGGQNPHLEAPQVLHQSLLEFLGR